MTFDQSEWGVLTFLNTAQVQHYEVGDAPVLGEGQTQRWFAAVAFTVDAVGVFVTVLMSVHGTLHVAIGYVMAWREHRKVE